MYSRTANRGRQYGSSVAARQAAAIALKPKVLSDSSSDDDAPRPTSSSKSSGRASQAFKTGGFPPVASSTPASSRKGKRKAATETTQEVAIDWKTVSNASPSASTSRTTRSKRARAGEEEADKPEDKATSKCNSRATCTIDACVLMDRPLGSPDGSVQVQGRSKLQAFRGCGVPFCHWCVRRAAKLSAHDAINAYTCLPLLRSASKSTPVRQRRSTTKTVEASTTSSMAQGGPY